MNNINLIYLQKKKIIHKIYKYNIFKTKLLYVLINIILLLINIIFLLKKNVKLIFNNKNLLKFEFKNTDYFNIALLNLTYQKITFYLNKKYEKNFLISNINLFKIKKKK